MIDVDDLGHHHARLISIGSREHRPLHAAHTEYLVELARRERLQHD